MVDDRVRIAAARAAVAASRKTGRAVDPLVAKLAQRDCAHEYVDRIVQVGPWRDLTKMVIYCKHCGNVTREKYL